MRDESRRDAPGVRADAQQVVGETAEHEAEQRGDGQLEVPVAPLFQRQDGEGERPR